MQFEDQLEMNTHPALPIIVAKWNKEVRAILICRAWKGVETHWYGNHTIACCGTENCPACDVGMKSVRKFYIAARSRRDDNQAILMITPTAATAIHHHRRQDYGLLGMEVVLGRSANRNTSPMTARVVNYHPDTPEFGQERLERVITRIFAANANLKVA
jgi:hypothetical protein